MQTNTPQVLPDGATRTQGSNAQAVNIMVAKMVAKVVKTTLGPKGMDKLLVNNLGDVTVTNDGVTILREMTIENPVAKMMVEVAKTQENEVGDGTTTAVIISGELLKNAEELLNKKIHPTVISKGYKLAAEKSIEILNKIGIDVKSDDKKTLINISKTAMTGKGTGDSKDVLSKIVVESVLQVSKKGEVELEDIKVVKKTGGSVEDSEIIEGIVLDHKRCHPNMPKRVTAPKIALIDSAIEIKGLDMDARVNITDPAQMQAFVSSEADMIEKMISKITESGANIIICSKNIHDAAIHFLAKAGVMALKRINREDLERISKATGSRIVTDLDELTKEDIGIAGLVEEKYLGNTDMTFIKECKDAKSITILVRGSTEQVTSEVKRAIEDAIGDIATMIRYGKAVGGAGAPEIILSQRIKTFAMEHTGRLQLVIEAFADALEVIPETLAENAGLDPIDVIADLKSSLNNSPIAWPGINVFSGKVMDSWEQGIIEPLRIKTQAIISASEVAIMVLRIDDVISIMHDPDQKKAQMASMQ